MTDPFDNEMPGADDWQGISDLDQEVARLAGLDAAAYEVERKTVAKSLDVRASVLDKLVKAARQENGPDDDGKQGRKLELPEIEPWHEPVDGQELISGLQGAICRHVILSNDEALACALWVLHAHAHDWFFISPKLHISSPEKQCGKSTLLGVLGPMVPRHLPTENITAAALFRTIESARPTLFIDEADSFINNSDDLRGILNAGHLKGGGTIRTVGDEYEPRLFSAWCPVVIAGIGRIPSTLEDRSIQIRLSRRKAGETVERLRLDRRDHLADMGRKAARWIADHEQSIRAGDPDLPEELSDRGQDNWRPLVTIADLISPASGQRARASAIAISGQSGDDDSSVNVMALADMWNVFDERNTERLPTSDIVAAFNEMEDRPWPEWRRGKEMSGTSLSRLLRSFDVRPKTIRFASGLAKGYEKGDLADAYQRFVEAPNASTAPSPPNPSVTPEQINDCKDLSENRTVTTKTDVTDEISPKLLKNNNCYGVTGETLGNGDSAYVLAEADGGDGSAVDEWADEL